MSIAYKECLESKYWLELLKDTEYLNEKSYNKLYLDADETGKILFKILKSSGRIKTMNTDH